jgi:LysM repeat protein
MGSVRKATQRQYFSFLLLNVVVSAVTVLLVLFIWDSRPGAPRLAPTATLDVLARVASAVPTVTRTPVPSPTSQTYTVLPGDTLYAISVLLDVPVEDLMLANRIPNPDALTVGQVLVIPEVKEGEGTPSPSEGQASSRRTPSATPGPQSPRIVINELRGGGDLESEAVILLNLGGEVNMAGWTLDDGEGAHVYRFPAFTFYNPGAVSIQTRSGTDSVSFLYWGLDQSVWLSGKTITLRDPTGTIHSTFKIP